MTWCFSFVCIDSKVNLFGCNIAFTIPVSVSNKNDWSPVTEDIKV